jgi:hypothetical protein
MVSSFIISSDKDNESVDALSRLGSSCEPRPPGVFMENLFKPSI